VRENDAAPAEAEEPIDFRRVQFAKCRLKGALSAIFFAVKVLVAPRAAVARRGESSCKRKPLASTLLGERVIERLALTIRMDAEQRITFSRPLDNNQR